MRTRLLASVIGSAVFAASAFSAAPARASNSTLEASDSAETLAQFVEDQAPAGTTAESSSASGVVATEHGLVQSGDVTLPPDGEGSLTAAGVTISMPAEFELGDVEVTDGGLAVYEGESAADPAVVVATDADSTAVHTVLPDTSAPMRHSYVIEGASPELREDGSVVLIGADGPVGFVAAPWAVDAVGEPVSTSFEVHGNTLVQIVEPTSSAQFPVIADPDLFFIAKCAGAVALFAAENGIGVTKIWRVFKSAKEFVELLTSLKKAMGFTQRVKYVSSRLAAELGQMSGITDLVSRCTP